jgi:hypothetical protein
VKRLSGTTRNRQKDGVLVTWFYPIQQVCDTARSMTTASIQSHLTRLRCVPPLSLAYPGPGLGSRYVYKPPAPTPITSHCSPKPPFFLLKTMRQATHVLWARRGSNCLLCDKYEAQVGSCDKTFTIEAHGGSHVPISTLLFGGLLSCMKLREDRCMGRPRFFGWVQSSKVWVHGFA